MKITTLTMVPDLDRTGSWAREAERLGFDGVFMAEGKRDPFLSLSRAVRIPHFEADTGGGCG